MPSVKKTNVYRAKKRIEDLRSRIFPMKLSDMDSATPRAVRLTHLTLTSYIGEPVLDAIKDYYLHNFSMSSCFQDLRRFVARLPLNEHRNFQLFINDHARTLRPNSENIPKVCRCCLGIYRLLTGIYRVKFRNGFTPKKKC